MSTASEALQAAFHLTARVQSGSRIEITAPDLSEGQEVEVFLIPRVPAPAPAPRPTAIEFLDALPPGPRSAETWDEIDRQLQEGRDSWDR